MNFILYALCITTISTSPSKAIQNVQFCNETMINQDPTFPDTVSGCCLGSECSDGLASDSKFSTQCSFGMSPNVCICDNQYKLNDTNKMCEPICKDQFENSRCIKPPNTWTCVENYRHDPKIDKCVLKFCLCNSNGYCLNSEDECLCYDEYTKNISNGQCEPQCQTVCENSVCVANNICECLDGYHKTLVDHVCEQNDLCNGHPCKNGECLITGECKCKADYVKSLSYSGQFQCDAIHTFIGKVMTVTLGVPVFLISCVSIIMYTFIKKKSNKVEDQEII